MDESSLYFYLSYYSSPPWLELDTLYYFGDKSKEDFKPKGDIKMIECQELIIKNMSKSKESGFSFKINMGDRLFHLMTDSELERMKYFYF